MSVEDMSDETLVRYYENVRQLEHQIDGPAFIRSREGLLDSLQRRMTSVLDLDPVWRSARVIGALATLRD
jgi:hypothetical protein